MQITAIWIKDFRQNISKISKEAREKNKTYLVLHRKKPFLEIRPCFNENISLDSEVQINYYKTLESTLDFWNSSEDDDIFKS